MSGRVMHIVSLGKYFETTLWNNKSVIGQLYRILGNSKFYEIVHGCNINVW